MAPREDDRGAVRRQDDLSISGVVDLVKTYAKQETVDPLKNAGRFLGFGAIGAVLLGIGLCLIALGLLRLVQTEFDNLARGGWSWLPYLIVLAVCVVVIVVAGSRIKKPSLTKERD
jgi:hypothetical protein